LNGKARRAKIEIYTLTVSEFRGREREQEGHTCTIKAFVPNSNNNLLTKIAKDICMDDRLSIWRDLHRAS
jgi:hypothetical protein